MNSLSAAHLQRRYTIFVVVVLLLSMALFAGVLLFGQTSATIAITPRTQAVTASVARTIGTINNADTLKGSVVTDTVSATVDAQPSTTGTPVDAHATGTMHVINTSAKTQPLASGTRFRAANGQIVRSTKRIDVNPGATVTVGVVADALGVAGNLEPGKCVIVALWAGLQDTIYGELKEPMTGGTTIAGATLDLAALNAASDTAQSQLSKENPSTETSVVLLTPKSVITSPKTTVASSTYKVTVTMTRLKITFSADDLKELVHNALIAAVPKGFDLRTTDQPTVTLQNATDLQHPTIMIRATGGAGISASSESLSAATFVGKSSSEVTSIIAALPSVSGVSVHLTPSWKKNLPTDAGKITVHIIDTQP